jgi:hypothetical protein
MKGNVGGPSFLPAGSLPQYFNPLDVNNMLADQFGELDPVLAG